MARKRPARVQRVVSKCHVTVFSAFIASGTKLEFSLRKPFAEVNPSCISTSRVSLEVRIQWHQTGTEELGPVDDAQGYDVPININLGGILVSLLQPSLRRWDW